jgi:hypothetical protein
LFGAGVAESSFRAALTAVAKLTTLAESGFSVWLVAVAVRLGLVDTHEEERRSNARDTIRSELTGFQASR